MGVRKFFALRGKKSLDLDKTNEMLHAKTYFRRPRRRCEGSIRTEG
jgi:hypothetical protein